MKSGTNFPKDKQNYAENLLERNKLSSANRLTSTQIIQIIQGLSRPSAEHRSPRWMVNVELREGGEPAKRFIPDIKNN
jgi:hypothetical protein